MRVMPAIDLREGACVQLVGGRYEDERVRIADPLAAARRWRDAGLAELHVVDLDAATGRGSNRAVVLALVAEPGVTCQAGGGVRDDDAVRALIEAGAARVIVGTRALEDSAWLARMAARFPGRLVVAADVRNRSVVTHGWNRGGGADVGEVIDALGALPLAAILVTAVHREGALLGTDLDLMRELATRSRLPIQASGGITSLDELRALAGMGVSAAVLGMSLYTGALDPHRIVEAFA
jgi:phosphoribosylformimino-5-aminoimidazole carboxamide ribotide isomerase